MTGGAAEWECTAATSGMQPSFVAVVDGFGLHLVRYQALTFSVPFHPYNSFMLRVDAHPLLDLRAFVTTFPRPLGEIASPHGLTALFNLEAAAPLTSDDAVREAVRVLLRHGGFKP